MMDSTGIAQRAYVKDYLNSEAFRVEAAHVALGTVSPHQEVLPVDEKLDKNE